MVRSWPQRAMRRNDWSAGPVQPLCNILFIQYQCHSVLEKKQLVQGICPYRTLAQLFSTIFWSGQCRSRDEHLGLQPSVGPVALDLVPTDLDVRVLELQTADLHISQVQDRASLHWCKSSAKILIPHNSWRWNWLFFFTNFSAALNTSSGNALMKRRKRRMALVSEASASISSGSSGNLPHFQLGCLVKWNRTTSAIVDHEPLRGVTKPLALVSKRSFS